MNIEIFFGAFQHHGGMALPILLFAVVSFVLAVFLTPRVAAVAERFDLLDKPSARKVHSLAIPRIGGVAIFLSFNLALLGGLLVGPVREQIAGDGSLLFIFAGGAIAFALGFYDDVRRLGPKVKFAVQIVAACFAYFGGIGIHHLGLPGLGLVQLGWLSLPVTVFWVLLVINAINLIDGLDGLAAGVSFFVYSALLALNILQGNTPLAIVLATMVGALLGFLVFNFNPASIFMGDSGSYFLGYMLATLSIFGSFKSHTAFTFLVPVVALGLPLLDTVWATCRRFLVGRKLFYPDSDHFHHRLLKLGYSHRRAVLVLYAITILLCALAFIPVVASDHAIGLLLFGLAAFIILFIRKLGYLNFLHKNAFLSWLSDVIDATGINRDRRVFFAYQLAILESDNMENLWERILASSRHLELDYVKMQLGGQGYDFKKFDDFVWHADETSQKLEELYSRNRLYMRFPLECNGKSFGVLIISKKDFSSARSHAQTLWRLEFLRRTLSTALHNFQAVPVFELLDRRSQGRVGDRGMHQVKEQLIKEIGERRSKAPKADQGGRQSGRNDVGANLAWG